MGKLSEVQYVIPAPGKKRKQLYLFRGEYMESRAIAQLTDHTRNDVSNTYRQFPECAEVMLENHISHLVYQQGWIYKAKWYSQTKLVAKLKVSAKFFLRFVTEYGRPHVQELLDSDRITQALEEFKRPGIRLSIKCSDGRFRSLTDACVFDKVRPKIYQDLSNDMPVQDRFELARKCSELVTRLIEDDMYTRDMTDMLHAGRYEEALQEYERRKYIRDFLISTRVEPPSQSTLARYYKMSVEDVINKTGTGRKIVFSDGTEHTFEEVRDATGFSEPYVRQLRTSNLKRLEDSFYAGGSIYRKPVVMQGRTWELRNHLYQFMNKRYIWLETDEQLEAAVLKDRYTDRLKFESISHEVTHVTEDLWTYKCPVCKRIVLCSTEELIDFKHNEDWCILHCVDEEDEHGKKE